MSLPWPDKTEAEWEEALAVLARTDLADREYVRDELGRFAETGADPGVMSEYAAAQKAGMDIEGGGPARAEWVKRNNALMEATDKYIDAKEAHRASGTGKLAQQAMEDWVTSHPNASVEMLNAKAELASPGWKASKEKVQAAEAAMLAAEQALKRQEPVMQKEVVKNLATGVAEKMGVDPSIIDVVHQPPTGFTVGEKQFTEAGHYSPNTQRIELNAGNMTYGYALGVKGVAAHELSHAVYHQLKHAADAEFERYLAKAIGPDGEHSAWYHERYEKVPGTLDPGRHATPEAWKQLKPEYRAEFTKDYPASAVLSHLAEGQFFTGIAQSVVDEDGHSRYAKSYWTPEARAARGHTYDAAINETIAEVTRHMTYPTSWEEDTTPSPTSPWVKLTKGMHEWYQERQEAAKVARMRLKGRS